MIPNEVSTLKSTLVRLTKDAGRDHHFKRRLRQIDAHPQNRAGTSGARFLATDSGGKQTPDKKQPTAAGHGASIGLRRPNESALFGKGGGEISTFQPANRALDKELGLYCPFFIFPSARREGQ